LRLLHRHHRHRGVAGRRGARRELEHRDVERVAATMYAGLTDSVRAGLAAKLAEAFGA
jgi:hypothetical protein